MQNEHPDLPNRFDYKIQYAPCSITGEMDKVIVTKVNTLDIEIDGEDGEKHQESLDVYTQESEQGLLMKLQALRAGELPIPAGVDPEGIRANCRYHWIAVYPDGRHVPQYELDGRENGYGDVNTYQITKLWVRPRDPNQQSPSYCLDRERGFLRLDPVTDAVERLDLPIPAAPFHYHYYRSVAITFGMGAPGEYSLPAHVQQVLGWRVDTLHGDEVETVCEIAIEDDDGSWQIRKMEPAESRHLQPKQIHAGVRVVELVEAP